MQLELLAPAKNKEIGIAAVDCGADALYIAGPQFGARESASNSMRDISEVVKYAHRFSVKVYMTVNTILYEEELESARKMIFDAYNIGCDAIIVQDLGILKMDLPPIALHASTQTAARTIEQVQFLESLGFRRVVLARELSLQQISGIRENSRCELEAFIHGSLCVSYSGQCYLSQNLRGRSANRGSCIQACRSLYDLQDADGQTLIKNAPLLSLKDLSLSDYIPQMVAAGISSFKIEGRLKNITYVKNITRYYRSVIDEFISKNEYYSKSSHGSIHKSFTPDPDKSFNRGYTTLFIDGKRGKWRSTESTGSLGEYIGTIDKVLKSDRYNITFSVKSDKQIRNGDGLLFINTDQQEGMRADVVKGSIVTVKSSNIIAQGVTIYRNFNTDFEKEIENSHPERLIDVSLTITSTNKEIRIEALAEDGRKAEYITTEALVIADNPDTALKNINNQLEKRSEQYLFKIKRLDLKIVPFFPLSQLNGFRREIVRILDETCIPSAPYTSSALPASSTTPYATSVMSGAKIKLPDKNISYLYNCSNSLSQSLYETQGAKSIQPAYELSSVKEAELMRCKYCIRYEIGKCSGMNKTKDAEPLYLINGKNRLTLKFDCNRCEMTIFH